MSQFTNSLVTMLRKNQLLYGLVTVLLGSTGSTIIHFVLPAVVVSSS